MNQIANSFQGRNSGYVWMSLVNTTTSGQKYVMSAVDGDQAKIFIGGVDTRSLEDDVRFGSLYLGGFPNATDGDALLGYPGNKTFEVELKNVFSNKYFSKFPSGISFAAMFDFNQDRTVIVKTNDYTNVQVLDQQFLDVKGADTVAAWKPRAREAVVNWLVG